MQQGKAKKRLAKKKIRYWKKTKKVHKKQDRRWKNKRPTWRMKEMGSKGFDRE